MKNSFKKGGRFLFHLTSQTDKEPRSNSEVTIGYTPKDWDSKKSLIINTRDKNVLMNGAKTSRPYRSKIFYSIGL